MPSQSKLRAVETARPRGARGTDHGLIELAREGDRGAWDRLYHLHYDAVLTRVRVLCGDLALAQELTQDAFFQAMVNIDKYDGRASFRTWLRSVALNIVRNYWRARRSKASAHASLAVVQAGRPHTATASSPEHAVLQRQRSAALYGALGRLSENLREVFVLHDIEGLDRAAVAEELGITPNNVSVRCVRARQRLREVLRASGWIADGEDSGVDGSR